MLIKKIFEVFISLLFFLLVIFTVKIWPLKNIHVAVYF